MPRTKPKPKAGPQSEPQSTAVNAPAGEVLTLAEAASLSGAPKTPSRRRSGNRDLPGREGQQANGGS